MYSTYDSSRSIEMLEPPTPLPTKQLLPSPADDETQYSDCSPLFIIWQCVLVKNEKKKQKHSHTHHTAAGWRKTQKKNKK